MLVRLRLRVRLTSGAVVSEREQIRQRERTSLFRLRRRHKQRRRAVHVGRHTERHVRCQGHQSRCASRLSLSAVVTATAHARHRAGSAGSFARDNEPAAGVAVGNNYVFRALVTANGFTRDKLFISGGCDKNTYELLSVRFSLCWWWWWWW